MKFNSKTMLIEHIKELVKEGYLKEHWDMKQVNGGTTGYKFYTINVEAVK